MKPPQRPVGALVIAILNFVFGGFGLLSILCGGLYVLFIVVLLSVMPKPPPPQPGFPARPDPLAHLPEFLNDMAAIPGFVPYAVVNAVKGFIAPFLLLISGYGLVKMRRYGRSLAIVYAILTLVFVVTDTAYTLGFFNEAFLDAYQRFLDTMPQPKMNLKELIPPGMLVGGTIFGALISSAYPIAILAVMFRRDVRAAYSGIAPVVLPSRGKRAERSASADEEVIEDALPGARPALEGGIKPATDPGLTVPKEDA